MEKTGNPNNVILRTKFKRIK